ncbi:HSP70-domain-containing protein, partial [Rozella allomycis CSF55]
EIESIEKHFVTSAVTEKDGEVAFKVEYEGKEQVFTMTELLAMYFTKIKKTVESDTKNAVSDVVISVPGYFMEAQRHAVLNAADIAGLNCLRLLNDTTAAAIQYGMPKFDMAEDKARVVCFVDIGHSAYSVSIVSFTKTGLTVNGVAYDRHLGGRNFDEVLVNHAAEEFKKKHGLDIYTNPKSLFRLRAACEKAKKVLSANSVASLSVEMVMNEIDISSLIKREDFEAMCEPLLERIEGPLKEALKAANMTVDMIDFVEIVGGSTRIPAIKEKISKFFNKEISTTLNQDECVAKGCALQCAIISPVFKVRDYSIQDVNYYPIRITYEPTAAEPNDTHVDLFQSMSNIPCAKLLTFYRSKSFLVEAVYPFNNSLVGKYMIHLDEENDVQIKVKVKLNMHGLLSFDQASKIENVVEKKIEENGEEKEIKKTNKVDLKIETINSSHSIEKINLLKENELKMAASDKLVADTEAKKNELEGYIYEMRDKIETSLSEFISEKDKMVFQKHLTELEDWLYDEGEDTTKTIYSEKLMFLQSFGTPVINRFKQLEERNSAASSLSTIIQNYLNCLSDPKYSHIPKSELDSISAECQKASNWLNSQLESQNKSPKHIDPVFKSSDIEKKQQELISFVTPILSKKKEEEKKE